MTQTNTTFVSFEPKDGKFIAFMAMEMAIDLNTTAAEILNKASIIYSKSISTLQNQLKEINAARAAHKTIEALKIWSIGDLIFELKDSLEKLSLEVDGLYEHLVRDLGVKRKWLEKVVIFRRYISNSKRIPQSLTWGQCTNGTRKVAQKIENGLSAD